MKIINSIKDNIIKICGVILMIPVIFYLNFYEFNPIYKPKSN